MTNDIIFIWFTCTDSFPLKSADEVKGLQSVINQQKAKIDLIDSNFTQTVQYLSQERDNALRDRDLQLQEAIRLRKDNTLVKEQLHEYTRYHQAFLTAVREPKNVQYVTYIQTVVFHTLSPLGSAKRTLRVLWTGSRQ